MFEPKKEFIQCDDCGKDFEVEIYEEVDGARHPELKIKILDGKFYTFRCPHCGHIQRKDYPIIYTDSEKGYIIECNSPAGLMFNRDYGNLEQGKRIYGVTHSIELAERILELDHDLNIPLCIFLKMMFCSGFAEIYEETFENGNIDIKDAFVHMGDENELEIVLVVENNIEEDTQFYTLPLRIDEMCKGIDERLLVRVKKMNPYYVNEEYVSKIIDMSDEEYKISENTVHEIAVCRDLKGKAHVAYIPYFNEGKFHEGDKVCVDGLKYKANLYLMSIEKILDLKDTDIPFIIGQMPMVLYKVKEVSGIKTFDENTTLNNLALRLALLAYKKTKIYPLRMLDNAKIIIGYRNVFGKSDEQTRVDYLLHGYKVKETGEERIFITDEFAKKFNSKDEENSKDIYLTVYLEQGDVPDDPTIIKNVVTFNDLIKIYYSMPGQFDGILIKTRGDEIPLSKENLIDYILGRVFSRSKLAINFLNSLDEKEKVFIGPESVSCMKEIFTDYKTIDELIGHNDIEKEELTKKFTGAYIPTMIVLKSRILKDD